MAAVAAAVAGRVAGKATEAVGNKLSEQGTEFMNF